MSDTQVWKVQVVTFQTYVSLIIPARTVYGWMTTCTFQTYVSLIIPARAVYGWMTTCTFQTYVSLIIPARTCDDKLTSSHFIVVWRCVWRQVFQSTFADVLLRWVIGGFCNSWDNEWHVSLKDTSCHSAIDSPSWVLDVLTFVFLFNINI
jgi:hypothetical protein